MRISVVYVVSHLKRAFGRYEEIPLCATNTRTHRNICLHFVTFPKTCEKPRATPAQKRDDVFSHPETRNRSCSATTTTEHFQRDYYRDRKHREIRRQRAGAVTENTTKNSKTHAFHAKSSARFTRLERHGNLGTVQLLHHESSSRFIRARRDIRPNR